MIIQLLRSQYSGQTQSMSPGRLSQGFVHGVYFQLLQSTRKVSSRVQL